MAIKRDEKKTIIKTAGKHPQDTGSPQVQVAILTTRIEKLADHLKKNPKDKHSKRGLLGLVSKRRTHLTYLSMRDETTYEQVVKANSLRK